MMEKERRILKEIGPFHLIRKKGITAQGEKEATLAGPGKRKN